MVYTVKDKEWKCYLYTGEVDLSDELCGFGTATHSRFKYESTWLNGKQHGIGMSLCMQGGALFLFNLQWCAQCKLFKVLSKNAKMVKYLASNQNIGQSKFTYFQF